MEISEETQIYRTLLPKRIPINPFSGEIRYQHGYIAVQEAIKHGTNK